MENNNTQQPDYLNPQSDKFYKGYRYEKDKDGNEIWFDENGTIRKNVCYYSNGNKRYETYFNKNGDFHNEEVFAFQRWGINGELKLQYYFLNGKLLTEQEWKEAINK